MTDEPCCAGGGATCYHDDEPFEPTRYPMIDDPAEEVQTMDMNPRTAIPPTPLLARQGKKRWHIARDVETVGVELPEAYSADRSFMPRTFMTLCGQAIHWPDKKLAYNANEVTCTDCVLAAIGRHADRIGGANR